MCVSVECLYDIHIQCNHAKQQQQQQLIAERCSGFTGAYTQISTTAATTLPGQPLIQHELDAPQPLVDRKPSVSLLRWNSGYNNNNNNNIYHNSTINNNNFLNIMSQQLPTTPSRSSSIRKQTDAMGGTGLPTTSATAARQGLN